MPVDKHKGVCLSTADSSHVGTLLASHLQTILFNGTIFKGFPESKKFKNVEKLLTFFTVFI